jgi:hypothetical protein
VTRYRVVAPMLTPATFTNTVKTRQVRAHYRDDEVRGVDQSDIDRLLAEGYIEIVPEPASISV